jgi:hypothetical protein
MGQMRFIVPQPERVSPLAAQTAYLAGPDGTPWECHRNWDNGTLTVTRETRESGNLYLPWRVSGHGLLTLSSGSLMEREQPYILPVELARGTITRLKNQAFLWETGGMQIPPEFSDVLSAAAAELAAAVTHKQELLACAQRAERAIELALNAVDLLVAAYTRQVLELRVQGTGGLHTLVGARLEQAPQPDAEQAVAAAVNLIHVAPLWSQVEPSAGARSWDRLDELVDWCRRHELRVCLGPLLQFDRWTLPDWLVLWQDELDEIRSYARQHVEEIVKRYRGRVHLWHVTGRMNLPTALQLPEEERLRLTVDAVETVRVYDPRTPMIVSFDQPWGEYIAREEQELTPIHFADTLVRGELGLAGIGLEMNLGYWPNGTLPRDLLEISRQIDRWSQLGVPLLAMVTVPAGNELDIRARGDAKALADVGGTSTGVAQQRRLADQISRLLLAKHTVQAIIWNQTFDDIPHEFPHAGLFDGARKPRPALQALAQIKQEFLK